MKDIYAKTGCIPTVIDFRFRGRPSRDTICRLFGDFASAKKASGFDDGKYKKCGIIYTREYLIQWLKDFVLREGRVPTQLDLVNTKDAPSTTAFRNHFDTLANAKIVAGIDVSHYETVKGRKAELEILKLFTQDGAIDMSGINWHSIFDGITPDGKTYDVKSSSLLSTIYNTQRWQFALTHKDAVYYFYLVAYDAEHKKILYIWRIPSSEINNKYHIDIGNNTDSINKYAKYELRSLIDNKIQE
jgi:hypothetical protein